MLCVCINVRPVREFKAPRECPFIVKAIEVQ